MKVTKNGPDKYLPGQMLFWKISVQKLLGSFFVYFKIGKSPLNWPLFCYHLIYKKHKNWLSCDKEQRKLEFYKTLAIFWYFYHPRRRRFSNNIASLADVVHLAAQSFDNHNRLPEAVHFSHTSTTHTASQIVGNRAIWSASKPKHVLLTYFKLPNKFS